MENARTYTQAQADSLFGTIPAQDAPMANQCPPGFAPYIIKSGETLEQIARRNNININELLLYNPSINPYYYKTGDSICLPGEPEPEPIFPPCRGGIEYTVRAGDTLRGIATRFNVTLGNLLVANPTVSDSGGRITVGQRLCIPIENEIPENPIVCSRRIRVPANSTYTDLLLRYNISYAALTQANPGVNLASLRTGQILCIPDEGERGMCPSAGGAYVIPVGGTLSSVARSLGTTTTTLLRLNPNLLPTDFVQGTLIRIP